MLSHETQRAWLARQGLGWAETHVVPRGPERPAPPEGALRRAAWAVASRLRAVREAAVEDRRYAESLRRITAGRSFGAVFCNNSVSVNRAAIRHAAELGVPVVVKQRGFEWRSRRVAALARSVDLFLPDSRSVSAGLIEMGVEPARVRPTWCAVDVDRLPSEEAVRRARASLGLGGARAVGIAGCLLEWKGQHVFLEAFARIARDRDVRGFVIGGTPTGEPTAWSSRLEALARELGVAGRVSFLGHREDVAALLGAMDVAVHASVAPEPFGTVVAEAMALGRPVVAADQGGPAEYVRDGETGLLHRAGDAADLARAIAAHLDDDDAARAMAEAGRRLAVERFASDRHAADTFELLARVAR
ncbi:MAG: D-inositol-3-phosphate glycosyltransferase [Planctomycetes bacterium]|nr:D-inositol-3-phosphate glycosyltransferase [Planctomycetota bacterium]